MDVIPFADLGVALESFLDPLLWVWIIVGVVIGMIFGAAPGLTATAGVAIATPLTFGLSFEASMALLLGIYCAGYFAGSIPAILINTPGAPGNAATALDGFAMAKRGDADRALGLAVTASFIGAMVSVIILMLAAPTLASFALEFTAVEYATLGLFGLICVAAISGGSLIKGMVAAVLGMFLGTIGIDPVGGAERLTFGMPQLLGGVPLLPALIAVFAITELLSQAAERIGGETVSIHKRTRLGELIGVYARSKWLTLKSSVIGTAIGILPGTGPTIASWIAYGAVSRGGKGEAELGSGVDRGIIASESANNAVTGGALVPLLTLGIPGDTVTAVLIGALLIQGIDPGPFFIVAQGDLFALILLILIASNSILLILGLGARRYLAALLKIPPRILAPIVAVLCAAGGFAISNSPFDVGLIAVLGVFAYVLMRFGVPMPPLVLGLVLGPIIERNLRDALTVHQMDFTVFVTRPISGALLAIILVTIGWTIVQRAKSKRAR